MQRAPKLTKPLLHGNLNRYYSVNKDTKLNFIRNGNMYINIRYIKWVDVGCKYAEIMVYERGSEWIKRDSDDFKNLMKKLDS